MKIKPLLIVILLITFSYLHAQEYTFGLKGGVNFNNIGELYHYGDWAGDDPTPIDDFYYTADKEMGVQFGAFGMVELDKFFIRPEVSYVSSKNNYPLAKKISHWASTKIDIPLLLGYKIFQPVSLYAGPSFSSISKMKLEGNQENLKPFTYKKTSNGINAGILVDFNRFGFDLRYQYGITKVEALEIDIDRGTYGTNRGRLLEYNPSQVQLSVHINILKTNSGNRGHKIKSGWRGGKRGC